MTITIVLVEDGEKSRGWRGKDFIYIQNTRNKECLYNWTSIVVSNNEDDNYVLFFTEVDLSIPLYLHYCVIYLTHSPHFCSHHTIYIHASFNYSQNHKFNQMLSFTFSLKINPPKAVDSFIINIPSSFDSFCCFPESPPGKRPPWRSITTTRSKRSWYAFRICVQNRLDALCMFMSPCRVTFANLPSQIPQCTEWAARRWKTRIEEPYRQK